MGIDPAPQHHQVSETLEQLKRFNTLLENQMIQSETGSFTASDEEKTVTATINGHRLLTGLSIEEGMLRLGAETVEQRINEAIANAQAEATAAIAGKQQQMIASLIEVTANLAKSVGLSL
ncbi:YbaB/EbfC family nucleoid-associated protein [Mycobacterium camsae]|uniref:YbaB/EbfC family nucleoid-associated protein n=1 Tax=Mycobacterium gordonae TaxID=1778 RepID=UPI00197D5559|nr:YbaB/EbfC family nucleoid-associated protein [Mycobacterium gordonae]